MTPKTNVVLVCGNGLAALGALASVASAQQDVAERESIVVAPMAGANRLKTSEPDGDVDNREVTASSPDELIKVAANDVVTVEYLGRRKLVGKRPVYKLTAVIEQEKTEDCKTKITRQPYEPQYRPEPTLELGRQLKIKVQVLSTTLEVLEERRINPDGTLDGGPLEVKSTGYVTIRYEYPAEDVSFGTRQLNNREVETMINPKLDNIRRMPNYKIVGKGYDGDVHAGDLARANVRLSVTRTR